MSSCLWLAQGGFDLQTCSLARGTLFTLVGKANPLLDRVTVGAQIAFFFSNDEKVQGWGEADKACSCIK